MKDMDQDPVFDSDTTTATGVWAGVVRWSAACATILLISGIALWTYQLGQRDASQVPVIKAMAGPAKIQPENPGGLQAENQGLSVNTVVEGTLPPARPESVVLAPAEETLRDEDVATADLPPRVIEPSSPIAVPDEVASTTSPAETPPRTDDAGVSADASEPVVQPPVIEAAPPAEELADASRPAGIVPIVVPRPRPALRPETPQIEPGTADASEDLTVATALAESEPAAAEAAPKIIDPVIGGSPVAPVITVAARERPTTLRTSVRVTTAKDREAAAIPVASRETDDSPELVKAGSMLIQLGAFATPEIARAQWTKIIGSHTDLLGSRSRVVERTTSGGRTFYRLRAQGFADLAEAKATCAALTARNAACIPVRQK